MIASPTLTTTVPTVLPQQACRPVPAPVQANAAVVPLPTLSLEALACRQVKQGHIPAVGVSLFAAPLSSGPQNNAALAEPSQKLSLPISASEAKNTKNFMREVRQATKKLDWDATSRFLDVSSRGLGAVGHGGRAIEKFQKGKYVDSVREGAQSLKNGLQFAQKVDWLENVPGEVLDSLGGVIAITRIEGFVDDLLGMIENPSFDTIDRFMAEAKLMLGQVDDFYRFGQMLVTYARSKGPALVARLRDAIMRSESQLMQVLNQVAPGLASTAGKEALTTVARIGSVTAIMIAGLDVSRAVLAAVELSQDSQNPELVGQLIKNSMVAVFSVGSVLPGAGWAPGLLAAGVHFTPDSVFTFLGREVLETLQADPEKHSFLHELSPELYALPTAFA